MTNVEDKTITREVVVESPLVKRLWRGAQGFLAATFGVIPVIIGTISTFPGQPIAAAVAPLAHLAAITATGLGLASIWLRRRAPRWADLAPLTASLDGAKLPDGTSVPRSEVVEATITPWDTSKGSWLRRIFGRGPQAEPGAYEVELKRKGLLSYPARFVTRTLEEARAIVEALGLDVTRRAVTRKVMSLAMQPKVTFAVVAAMFGSMLAGGVLVGVTDQALFGLIGALGVLGVFSLQLLGFVRTQVRIGGDGVSVKWLSYERTVPLTDIARLEVEPRTLLSPAKVRIHRKSGAPLEILVGIRGNNPFEPYSVDDECSRILERIQEAIDRGGKEEPTEFRFWADRRQSMTTDAWLAALRGVLDGYRDGEAMPFTKSELFTVIENVRATELERVAATIALGPTSDERTREHLLDVAAATAMPKLKLALEAAARGDDAILGRTLAELRDRELESLRVTAAETPRVRIALPEEEAPTEAHESDESDEAAREAEEREGQR